MQRPDKINHYLDIAETWAKRGTCLRRVFGAVIVKNDEVIASGYNGAPRGRQNCCDMGVCVREELKVPRGRMYEVCRSVHAEQNAIIQAKRQDMLDSTMYVVGLDYNTGELIHHSMSCELCKRMILNAGVKELIFRDTKTEYRIVQTREWIEDDETLRFDINGAGY